MLWGDAEVDPGAEFAASVENDPEPTDARRRSPDAAIRRTSGAGSHPLSTAVAYKFLAMPRHEADHSAGAQTHNVHCRDLKEPTEADAL